jgi:mycothiol synthase
MTPTTMRRYQGEDDFWQIRQFLREVFLLNQRREISWPVARLDYWRWFGIDILGDGQLETGVFIWEMPDGRMAAVLNRESAGQAFLQLHPGLRTPQMEAEMLEVAEANLAVAGPDGRRKLTAWADWHDASLQGLLKQRGYTKENWPEYQHRYSVLRPTPAAPIAAGYTVRALGEGADLPARCWASWKAFHPNEPDERYLGGDWYPAIQRCPLYRRDLDLVAVAPTGELASFTTVWYDDVTRSAYFEPVGTHPAHQRRGLAKAVMAEGLRRLERLGATLAFVGGYSTAANALYNSFGPEYDLSEPWAKEW